MMLLSGGKDSTYALCRLVDLGLRVYAFSLDNGYISTQAKDNIRRVVKALGVDHEFATTSAMAAIFRDSLSRFSNVCNGCFKTIYTLSMTRAHQLRIPTIVTGLSRGQMFETRLTPELFRQGRTADDVDAAILAARKAYHRADDEVARSLDVSLFRDDRIFDDVSITDFYRYSDVELDEMLAYLQRRVPWMRPSDTGRSTNCLANDAGIYIHVKERGYHNYALPYSWDVRLGHKTRAAAIHELHDQLDVGRVRGILADIGYDERRSDATSDATATPAMVAYIVAARDVTDKELRRHLADRLPAPLIPSYFTRVSAIPLSASGKVDERALAMLGTGPATPREAPVPPQGIVEQRIAAVWAEVLGIGNIGSNSSFFELGGTSLGAMEAVLRICAEFGVDLPLQAIFTSNTVSQLANAVEALVAEEVAAMSDEDVARLAPDPDLRL
jgi:acyl carrier protein